MRSPSSKGIRRTSDRHHLSARSHPLLGTTLAALLALTPAQASSAEIAFGGILPGTLATKSVTSLRERRFENLIVQQTDFSCGAAALATILKYAYGLQVDEAMMLEGLFAVSDPVQVRARGFSLLDIKRYVQEVGMRGRGYRVPVANLHQVKVPTIVLLDIKGYKHFAVLRKTVGDQVFLGDPALGNRVMKLSAFADTWNGVVFAVIGSGYDTDSVLANPQEPLTVSHLIDTFAPVTAAELYEFGFLHSQLF